MTERRNRGLLTMKDRTVLEKSDPDQYPRNFHARTREKLRSGVADLAALSENMEDRDIAQVFNVLAEPDLAEETSYTHEPFTRDTVVNALALFLQAIDVVSDQDEAALEDLIRDAVIRAYSHNHPDKLVGVADLDLETASRRGAGVLARRKYRRGERLNPTEMRALIEVMSVDEENQTTTGSASEELLSGEDSAEYVLEHLSEIEPGLEKSEIQENSQPEGVAYPMILCVDQDEKPVLIALRIRPPSRGNIEGLEAHLREYGGPDQARGILVVPDIWDGVAEMVESRRGLEIRELQLDQSGEITGIDDPVSP